MKLIFATHNPGKVSEMRALLAGLPIDVLSADEAGIYEDVIEDGETYEANAYKKAHFALSALTPSPDTFSFADDSGFAIDALGGRPGVHSARWAGDNATDDQIVAHTLKELSNCHPGESRGPGDRSASHITYLVLLAPKITPSPLQGEGGGEVRRWTFSGTTPGTIATAPRGTPRPKFPYDTIFIPDGHIRTYAEMSGTKKNDLSPRGHAFRDLRDFLATIPPS